MSQTRNRKVASSSLGPAGIVGGGTIVGVGVNVQRSFHLQYHNEVHLSKASNPQLLPRRCSLNGRPLLRVCVPLHTLQPWTSAESRTRRWAPETDPQWGLYHLNSHREKTTEISGAHTIWICCSWNKLCHLCSRCVCTLDGLNAEHKFVWVTILGRMSCHFVTSYTFQHSKCLPKHASCPNRMHFCTPYHKRCWLLYWKLITHWKVSLLFSPEDTAPVISNKHDKFGLIWP